MQDRSNETDTVETLAISGDDSVVLVGYTEGNWNATNAGNYDCVAIKPDTDGTNIRISINISPGSKLGVSGFLEYVIGERPRCSGLSSSARWLHPPIVMGIIEHAEVRSRWDVE